MNKKLARYLKLIQERSELFTNPEAEGVIKIITDPARIQREQRSLRRQLRAKGQPGAWVDIGVLVEDPWFLVLRDIVEFPNGQIGRYIRFLNSKSSLQGGTNVVILAVQNGNVVLLRHFRHEERRFYWETPRGFGEPGISAEEMARIELREELQVEPVRMVQVGFEKEGASGGTAYYFAALPGEANLVQETSEGIGEMKLVPIAELDAWIEDGRLMDSLSLKVFILAKIRGLI